MVLFVEEVISSILATEDNCIRCMIANNYFKVYFMMHTHSRKSRQILKGMPEKWSQSQTVWRKNKAQNHGNKRIKRSEDTQRKTQEE